MKKMYEDVLIRLYEKANKTNDHMVINCDIGVSGENRKEACEYLEQEGYIKDVQYQGKVYVQCKVTQKTFDYLDNIIK